MKSNKANRASLPLTPADMGTVPWTHYCPGGKRHRLRAPRPLLGKPGSAGRGPLRLRWRTQL